MTAHPEDDELPIIQRRRIEANIIAPIYRRMVDQLGHEKAADIIRDAITEDARKAGERFAALEKGDANLKTFFSVLELWKREDALVSETVVETETQLEFNVTRCRYAEMYREMGLEEIGGLLSCVRDYEFMQGYNPNITYSRTQTLMQGASHCDFKYHAI